MSKWCTLLIIIHKLYITRCSLSCSTSSEFSDLLKTSNSTDRGALSWRCNRSRSRRWLIGIDVEYFTVVLSMFRRERQKSPEIALYLVHLHTCHRTSSLFTWPWSLLDHRSLAQRTFVLFLQLLSCTNSCQLSLRIMMPDFSHACHVTLVSVSTQRRLVPLLNYYWTHIPDNVSTYSFALYVNYHDLLTQQVELGWSSRVLRDWHSAVHVIMWPTSSGFYGAIWSWILSLLGARMLRRVMRLVVFVCVHMYMYICICIYMSTKNRLFSALPAENLLLSVMCSLLFKFKCLQCGLLCGVSCTDRVIHAFPNKMRGHPPGPEIFSSGF